MDSVTTKVPKTGTDSTLKSSDSAKVKKTGSFTGKDVTNTTSDTAKAKVSVTAKLMKNQGLKNKNLTAGEKRAVEFLERKDDDGVDRLTQLQKMLKQAGKDNNDWNHADVVEKVGTLFQGYIESAATAQGVDAKDPKFAAQAKQDLLTTLGKLVGENNPSNIGNVVTDLAEFAKDPSAILTDPAKTEEVVKFVIAAGHNFDISQTGKVITPMNKENAAQALSLINQVAKYLPNNGMYTKIFAPIGLGLGLIASIIMGYYAVTGMYNIIPWAVSGLIVLAGVITDKVKADQAKVIAAGHLDNAVPNLANVAVTHA